MTQENHFTAQHRMTGCESEAVFCHYHQRNFCSSLLGLEQVPRSGHERIIKPLHRDYGQDDEKLVAKCMTKQEDYKGLYSILL